MNSPDTPTNQSETSRSKAAVVVDQLDLVRVGLGHILTNMSIHVAGSSSRAGDGLRIAKESLADFLIVGKHTDLKPQHALREAKKKNPSLRVVLLLDQAESEDIARLLSLGADGLLLRSVKADEFAEAMDRLVEGERVVATAFALGTLGRIGPNQDVAPEDAFQRSGLSRKELEVLAELASGATYKEIAESLIVTQATVKTHLVHIYSKLGVRNRQDAVARALALGLLA